MRSLTTVGFLALTLIMGSGGCADDEPPLANCGAGDAFSYAGAEYCVYTAAIIIEGFDCPALLPFGQEMSELLVCAPSGTTPQGGWEAFVRDWEARAKPANDVAQSETRSSDPETSDVDTNATGAPDDAGIAPDNVPAATPDACFAGLVPGQCWDASQCPSAWSCAGAQVDCTPCVDCPEAAIGTPGSCQPEPGADALGLLGWPGVEGGAGDIPIVFWWIDSASFALLECPSFVLEFSDEAGEFSEGPAEDACAYPEAVPSGEPIVRPGPAVIGGGAAVRARGHYRTGCYGHDPGDCEGEVELVSGEIVLH